MSIYSCNVSSESSWLIVVLVRVSPRPGTIMFSMWPSVTTLVVALICPCFSNSFLASGDFCRILITFANSLDPDQALIWVKAGWHSDSVHEIISLKSWYWKKFSWLLEKHQELPGMQGLSGQPDKHPSILLLFSIVFISLVFISLFWCL